MNKMIGDVVVLSTSDSKTPLIIKSVNNENLFLEDVRGEIVARATLNEVIPFDQFIKEIIIPEEKLDDTGLDFSKRDNLSKAEFYNLYSLIQKHAETGFEYYPIDREIGEAERYLINRSFRIRTEEGNLDLGEYGAFQEIDDIIHYFQAKIYNTDFYWHKLKVEVFGGTYILFGETIANSPRSSDEDGKPFLTEAEANFLYLCYYYDRSKIVNQENLVTLAILKLLETDQERAVKLYDMLENSVTSLSIMLASRITNNERFINDYIQGAEHLSSTVFKYLSPELYPRIKVLHPPNDPPFQRYIIYSGNVALWNLEFGDDRTMIRRHVADALRIYDNADSIIDMLKYLKRYQIEILDFAGLLQQVINMATNISNKSVIDYINFEYGIFPTDAGLVQRATAELIDTYLRSSSLDDQIIERVKKRSIEIRRLVYSKFIKFNALQIEALCRHERSPELMAEICHKMEIPHKDMIILRPFFKRRLNNDDIFLFALCREFPVGPYRYWHFIKLCNILKYQILESYGLTFNLLNFLALLSSNDIEVSAEEFAQFSEFLDLDNKLYQRLQQYSNRIPNLYFLYAATCNLVKSYDYCSINSRETIIQLYENENGFSMRYELLIPMFRRASSLLSLPEFDEYLKAMANDSADNLESEMNEIYLSFDLDFIIRMNEIFSNVQLPSETIERISKYPEIIYFYLELSMNMEETFREVLDSVVEAKVPFYQSLDLLEIDKDKLRMLIIEGEVQADTVIWAFIKYLNRENLITYLDQFRHNDREQYEILLQYYLFVIKIYSYYPFDEDL